MPQLEAVPQCLGVWDIALPFICKVTAAHQKTAISKFLQRRDAWESSALFEFRETLTTLLQLRDREKQCLSTEATSVVASSNCTFHTHTVKKLLQVEQNSIWWLCVLEKHILNVALRRNTQRTAFRWKLTSISRLFSGYKSGHYDSLGRHSRETWSNMFCKPCSL